MGQFKISASRNRVQKVVEILILVLSRIVRCHVSNLGTYWKVAKLLRLVEQR